MDPSVEVAIIQLAQKWTENLPHPSPSVETEQTFKYRLERFAEAYKSIREAVLGDDSPRAKPYIRT